MKIIDGLHNCELAAAVVVIGNFDGCHLGHRKLLEQTRALADELAAQATVLTFTPHPEIHFGGLSQADLLFSREQKIDALAAAGMDAVVFQTFDDAFLQTTHEDFYERLLKQQLRATGVVVGQNFRFGYQRLGSGKWMQEEAAKDGLRIVVGDHVENDEGIISSTRIRRLLRVGNTKKAMACLGRPYALDGVVKQGLQKGRDIGIPTLNLDAYEQLIPEHGVYAGFIELAGTTPKTSPISPKLHELLPGVFNIGTRPTINGSGLSIEGHALDQKLPEAYGKKARFYLVEHLRTEKKFPSFEDLRQQITQDIEQARQVLHIEI